MRGTSTRSLDLRGVPDGAQLATAAVAMLALRPGELLEVLADDPHATRDFAVWCRAGGHRLVEHDQRDGVHHLIIQASSSATGSPSCSSSASTPVRRPRPRLGPAGRQVAPP
jgi:tRNA 2-thiouridine synthesizing protein A